MAAVFCLVFLPALAATGLMVQTIRGDLSAGPAMAGMMFTALASGLFYGLLRMARGWENEEPSGT
jgi:hypothetical protein